jgi:hypothetical protein
MVKSKPEPKGATQGHVALYARNAKWRKETARSLDEAGHSHQEVGSPQEIARMLRSQRFDVLALRVSGQDDAADIARALEGLSLPPHSIVVGDVDNVPPALSSEQPGTLRVVPGELPARDLGRLVDISISSGGPDETSEEDDPDLIEEVDIEEEIERAAAGVYALAHRKKQRFSTVVEGSATHALANPAGLRRALAALLRLAVEIAPRGARVAVDARSDEGWQVCIRAGGTRGKRSDRASVAAAIGAESKVLAQASEDIHSQGGFLWVELVRPGALALCFTLPVPEESSQEATHAV